MRQRTSATFTTEEHERVRAAIAAAETRTSGEIYCVLAHDSDGYFFPASFALTVAMLALSLILGLVLDGMWYDLPLAVFATAQGLAFLAGMAVLAVFPGLRIRLVPPALQHRRAHQNAVKQFLARNIHRTEARTGVLIFVSLAERYAEVIADAAIDERVDQSAWDETVRLLVAHAAEGRIADSFVEAIGRVGALLAEHFPPSPGDRNELDDHLVEI